MKTEHKDLQNFYLADNNNIWFVTSTYYQGDLIIIRYYYKDELYDIHDYVNLMNHKNKTSFLFSDFFTNFKQLLNDKNINKEFSLALQQLQLNNHTKYVYGENLL